MMRIVLLLFIVIVVVVVVSSSSMESNNYYYVCPIQDQQKITFHLNETTNVVLERPTGITGGIMDNITTSNGILCLLSILINPSTNNNYDENKNGHKYTIPVARTYDGRNWERTGGSFAAIKTSRWDCTTTTTTAGLSSWCSNILPGNYTYQLQTRIHKEDNNNNDNDYIKLSEIVRFLEKATFGITQNDLVDIKKNKPLKQQFFAQEYIHKQIYNIGITSHREYFRKHINARWEYHHPEFASSSQLLNPCNANSSNEITNWRRQILTEKDLHKNITIQKYSDGKHWEINIDNHIRAIVKQIRFPNNKNNETSNNVVESLESIQDEGIYELCSSKDDVQRNIYKLRLYNRKNGKLQCMTMHNEDLYIDFPSNYVPDVSIISKKLPTFNDTKKWITLSNYTPDYTLKYNFTCEILNNPSLFDNIDILQPPIFARTIDGIWVQYDPRIILQKAPISDGGLHSLEQNHTLFCGNIHRSFINEDTCFMSNTKACPAGSNNPNDAKVGVIICDSPGEVGNNNDQPTTMRDYWLDIASMTKKRSEIYNLPLDTTPQLYYKRQREYVWSQIVLSSSDQLRQRIAWSLFQRFALPPTQVSQSAEVTEIFLNYYDIFVRNAFGNFRNVLREVTYNPLMSQSLSYINSKSTGSIYAKFNIPGYPDENYAREIMQLFTIGLIQLNIDGTPILDVHNNTIRTYDSDDILNFAKAWTGFVLHERRANIEEVEENNRIDPIKIDPFYRDRFPKTDLYGGYIGDKYYPLCIDLPEKTFLVTGAKYRILGTTPLPELISDDSHWALNETTKRLHLQKYDGSGLYDLLCAPNDDGSCSYPSVVRLNQTLICPQTSEAAECLVETVRVVQVNHVYYEYVTIPCIEMAFYEKPSKLSGQNKNHFPVCSNPNVKRASEACCSPNSKTKIVKAIPNCLYGGERMTKKVAQARCEAIDMELCENFDRFVPTPECPNAAYHWTSDECKMQIKIDSEGRVAIVHDTDGGNYTMDPFVSLDNPNFFRVHWNNKSYPVITDNTCNSIQCQVYKDTCLCDIIVSETVVFSSPPANAGEILKSLHIGHIDPNLSNTMTYISLEYADYRIFYRGDEVCCDEQTIFEVNVYGQRRYLRNIRSSVSVAGSGYNFRNPPQFNSLVPTEFTIGDAESETDAVLDHFFYHPNTAPFLALHLIQRFGISNPSPEYVERVATSFQSGSFRQGDFSFGSGEYGDLAATIATVLLDDEARSPTLEKDPDYGSLKEPILKVLSFMRAMDFVSTVPLVELDSMNNKIGQMVYEQETVFSFFRPEYSPPGAASSATLVAPEVEIITSTKTIGLMNGLFSLIRHGLMRCDDGFGGFGTCSDDPSGVIAYGTGNVSDISVILKELSLLLTSGRLDLDKQNIIKQAILPTKNSFEDKVKLALQLAASSPEFHTTNRLSTQVIRHIKDEKKRQLRGGKNSYKVVLHLALKGGCDSFNVLVPHPTCSELSAHYKSVRGIVALNDEDILRLEKITGQVCSDFGLHSGLSHVKQLFDDKDLVFFANTGVLTQPVNKTDYSWKTVTQLFAHNAMQEEIDALDPKRDSLGTGVLGRLASVLNSLGYRTGRTSVASTPGNLASLDPELQPILALDQNGVTPLKIDPSFPDMKRCIDKLNPTLEGDAGLYGELWSTILGQSMNQTEELYNLLSKTETKTEFASTPLAQRFKLLAKLIAIRKERGVDRDFFVVDFGSFDTHSAVTTTLQALFAQLNEALSQLTSELKEMGVWDDFVLVQSSDFGRTLTPNNGKGTDHGWGGNYFFTGGSVRGGRILGKFPSDLSPNSLDSLDRGRIIPSTPWDSVFNAIAEWTGVESEQDLDSVLPNRNNFRTLFSAYDLFDDNDADISFSTV